MDLLNIGYYNNETVVKPELIKRMNMGLIYKVLISRSSATRGEISKETQISLTTVRTLLEELKENGDVIELKLDESSGGRRAQRYTINPEKNLILTFCVDNGEIIYKISDLLSNVKEEGNINAIENNIDILINFMLEKKGEWDICSVGIGVPGIVKEKHFYISKGFNIWHINKMGQEIQEKLNIPVILENDLNAIAYGYVIDKVCEFNDISVKSSNIVYIHFNNSCIGAGIIVDGRIVHGNNKFAGELGFLPWKDGKNINEILKYSTYEECVELIARIISILNCVINPSLVVVGGDNENIKNMNLEIIYKYVKRYISDIMMPNIALAENDTKYYLEGLTHLTARNYIENI
ncbi:MULTISPECIES: ROK family protein [Clostridium]|uniref:ROK family protein n=1 Tax=Clostridium cibarium TaxID=2762247 RepID=A0ABR8PR26_9CLOT|nr:MULTISPECIES: ROK family protein [Clostridium]MBD7910634.1 ROK family protein [Clostridium cibarium]